MNANYRQNGEYAKGVNADYAHVLFFFSDKARILFAIIFRVYAHAFLDDINGFFAHIHAEVVIA